MKKIVEPLLNWYEVNKRDLPWRKNNDPYRIWISEIMLQQTQVNTVKPYYLRFLSQLPNVESLANVDDDQLLKLWEGLGYYSRARNLKIAANQIMNEYNGEFPKTFNQLLKLKGIGPYTAGAIASIAYNEQVSAVDGNALRVVSRVLNQFDDISKTTTVSKINRQLNEIMPQQAGDFNQALMELGATICTPKTYRCDDCPIAHICESYKQHTQQLLPVKNKKITKKIEEKTVVILVANDKLAIVQNDKKLLHKLWIFPMYDSNITTVKLLESYDAYNIIELGKYTHIFTHIEWEMRGVVLFLNNELTDYTWVTPYQLQQYYSLPTAFKYYFDLFVGEMERRKYES